MPKCRAFRMQPLPRCVKEKHPKRKILLFFPPHSDEATESEYMSIQLQGQDGAQGESQQQTVSPRQCRHS